MGEIMKILFIIGLFLVNINTLWANEDAQACESPFQVVTEFRYILNLAWGELSDDQQRLAQKFLMILDQEVGTQILCLSTSTTNTLSVSSGDGAVTGVMIFDELGEIENLFFEE
jgi:hypothetical protein